MKTSAVLTSLLFGSIAAAAPFDRRALVYKTEVVTETVVVYTTVWDNDAVAQATTTPAGYFYEQPKGHHSSSAPQVTPTPQASAEESSSVAPAPQEPTTTPSPTPIPTPTPTPTPSPSPVVVQSSEAPQPTQEAEPTTAAPQPTTTTSAYVAPPQTSAAPAPASSAPASGTPSSGGSMQYSGVDITIYDIPSGASGACGTVLAETDMIVALSKGLWGASTYDVMTGASTNPWCGQKISIEYDGRAPVVATIMDLCPGCLGPDDIDLSPAVWKQVTGLDEKTRLKASWSKID